MEVQDIVLTKQDIVMAVLVGPFVLLVYIGLYAALLAALADGYACFRGRR